MTPEEIVSLRNRLGWTQTIFAQFMGVTIRSVQYWESGHIPPNIYQDAILQRLRARLDEAESLRLQDDFQKSLQSQLPAILFGAGVIALIAFLFSENTKPKKKRGRPRKIQ